MYGSYCTNCKNSFVIDGTSFLGCVNDLEKHYKYDTCKGYMVCDDDVEKE